MLKNILFGRRTKKWKKGEKFSKRGIYVKKGRWRGMKEGHEGTGKGVLLEKGSVRCPIPTGYLFRKRCTSSPWVIKYCGSCYYGWRGMVHGGSRGGSLRAYAYAHIICVPCFLRNGSSGRMAGVWREGDDGKPGNGGAVTSETSGNYGTVHFRNKKGRKKRWLTFKKVSFTF